MIQSQKNQQNHEETENGPHIHGPHCSHHDHESNHLHNRIKVGRNDPCPCGSGRKYKKCCGA